MSISLILSGMGVVTGLAILTRLPVLAQAEAAFARLRKLLRLLHGMYMVAMVHARQNWHTVSTNQPTGIEKHWRGTSVITFRKQG